MFHRRQRREQNALRMMIDDDELILLHESRLRRLQCCGGTCGICLNYKPLEIGIGGCAQHLTCSECKLLASQSEVKTCPSCPIARCALHLECEQCKTTFFLDGPAKGERLEFVQCPTCSASFMPKLSRFVTHGVGVYTNFVTEQDSQHQNRLLADSQHRVWCPTCKTALERDGGCNELWHCGVETVCAGCGAMKFRFETSFWNHFKECSEIP